MITNTCHGIVHREACRLAFKPFDIALLVTLANNPPFRLLPKTLGLILRMTYGKMCPIHNSPMRVSHLIAEHHVPGSIDDALSSYQLGK